MVNSADESRRAFWHLFHQLRALFGSDDERAASRAQAAQMTNIDMKLGEQLTVKLIDPRRQQDQGWPMAEERSQTTVTRRAAA